MISKNNYELLDNFLSELYKVDNLENLDSLVDNINESVNTIYPCISCKSGCNTCCTGSIPVVTPKEWQRIRKKIASLPENIQTKIHENAESYYSNFSEILHLLHVYIHNDNLSEGELKEVTIILKDQSCPLLIDNRCSVYSSRPLICRAFGTFFNSRTNYGKTLFSCQSDQEKMINFIFTNNVIHPKSLPLITDLRKKLNILNENESEIYKKAFISLWLKSDIYSGKLNLQKVKDSNITRNYEEDLYQFGLEKEFKNLFFNNEKNNSEDEKINQLAVKLENVPGFLLIKKIKEVLLNNAFKFLEKNDYSNSEAEFNKLLRYEENNVELNYHFGFCKYKQKKYGEAITSFAKSLKLGLYNYEICFFMAECLKCSGDQKTSDIYYQKAKQFQISNSL